MLAIEMRRYTTFRFCLDPTNEQRQALARHAGGASRFAFNECLRMVKSALSQSKSDSDSHVPWTGFFDLISAFNTWKKSEEAGRVVAVDAKGVAELVAGLHWRAEVCQQVFEEAAVDCSRALAAWSDSRQRKRKGKAMGFPRFKKKTRVASFRLRNKHSKGRPPAVRVGDNNRPRSITMPGIGQIGVHDDTRRLRRMLANGRARILFATVSHRAGRWWVSLNIEAAELHPALRHKVHDPTHAGGWIGIDRGGLAAFVVAANAEGREVARITDAPPKALARGLERQRRLARSLSRKKKGSNNRRDGVAKLARHHHRVANIRRHFLHHVSNTLVKNHDRLVIEDLYVAGMLTNRRLARAICDASWAKFARQLSYKQQWRGGELVLADRWYPSSRLCLTAGSPEATSPWLIGSSRVNAGMWLIATPTPRST